MAIAQTLLDELWDFSDPAASQVRLGAAADDETDAEARAELETQVARALGLQERYDDADAVLDRVPPLSVAVSVRIALERGRLRNSGGDPAAAVPLFRAAAEAATSAGLVFLLVDALHMLAIADRAHAAEWTAHALRVLDADGDARTQRWRVGLHNNAGWALFDAEDYAAAVAEFELAKDAATRWGTPQQVAWADEALAEARALL
ncbi:hypothetical protein [Microbacterium deminutum]|uniref:Tetratricopeptide repeat protein n=1 Tax=Microbacterium deminutum TaxID=344164 RepID=A0ABP5CER2_9MICO